MQINAKVRLQAAAQKWTVTFSFKDRDRAKIDYPITVPAEDKAEAKAKAIKRFIKDHGSSVSYTVPSIKLEALTEKQKQLDIDGDGKIDGEDLKKVREGAKPEVKAAKKPYVAPKKTPAQEEAEKKEHADSKKRLDTLRKQYKAVDEKMNAAGNPRHGPLADKEAAMRSEIEDLEEYLNDYAYHDEP